MAKKDRLIKSKSIYTIKKKHTSTNVGDIFENDYVTIIPNDGIYDADMALFSESNFKYRIRTENNGKKRHIRNEFIKNGDKDSFTYGDLVNIVPSEESKIVLKPNYSSLSDFAYYGSAKELLKATINDIIYRFPGGLSYYDDFGPVIEVEGKKYFVISNEFEIDCWSLPGDIINGTIKNPLRYLALSYADYNLTEPPVITINGNCLSSIIGNVELNVNDNKIKLFIYLNKEGKKILLSEEKGTGVIIQPKQEIIDKFWDTLDDFERVLLNRNTTPVYKAVLETPFFTEDGYFYENKSYIWPTVGNDGFTPDLTSGAFQMYLNSLLSLADFHDTYNTDNIWRVMTHESIKNLDWTFKSNEDDLSEFDTTGIGAMIRLYGRLFDDIKRSADNLKSTISISYDEKNNIPDYFLTDVVENNGWQAKHVAPFGNDVTENDGTFIKSGKTCSYVNCAFLRRLGLSSNYIQSMKGTRRGIESILNLFGYTEESRNKTTDTKGTYSITEYVGIVSSAISASDISTIRSTIYYDYADEVDIPDITRGYPIALVMPTTEEDEEIPTIPEGSYIVPWFDKTKEYDYPFYFQGKGGWGKVNSKTLNLSSEITTATTLNSSDISIYGETKPYMKFALDISDMLNIDNLELKDNTICYVLDITTIMQQYTVKPGETLDDCSNYFILKNKDLSSYCGFVDNDLYYCYGWKNIPKSDINNCVGDGARVVYLESLNDTNKGNNPHTGYGEYDDGEDYLHHFENLFEGAVSDGLFDIIENSTTPIIGFSDATVTTEQQLYKKLVNSGFGFDIKEVVDNKKCAYYGDVLNQNSSLEAIEGETDITWNYPDDLKNFNPEEIDIPDDSVLDESQANGLINVKKLVINFNIDGDMDFKNYIQNVVLKYLEPMIPSTSILEYRFDNEPVSSGVYYNNSNKGNYTQINNVHAVYLDETENNPDEVVWGKL